MRTALTTTLALTLCLAVAAQAEEKKEGKEKGPALLNHEVKTIDGKKVNLAEKYAGKVVLVVNVASKCGYTPQYADLQKLHEKYAGHGLAILGFPCNQFGGQEPGDEQQIKAFCEENYGVEFDMFSKIDVKGENQTPLYKLLTSKQVYEKDAGDVKWNFEKFLINREGKVVARMRSRVKPTSESAVEMIEKELKKK